VAESKGETGDVNPFAEARAHAVARASFVVIMVVSAVGFTAFYLGGGGLLFGGGHTFDLTVAGAGYVASLGFLFGFYGLLADWARAGSHEGVRIPRLRGGLPVLVLALLAFVLLAPTLLPFVRRRSTRVGFAALATLLVAPLVAIPIVIAADAAFARLLGL
jgi:hypothetical protein